VLAFAREGYRKTDFNLADFFDAVTFSGLWRFLARHKRMSWEELKRSFQPASVLRVPCNGWCRTSARRNLETGGAGVRAQAMSPDGTLVQDFCFQQSRAALHVLNAPSPGATASLAIGEEIARMAAGSFEPQMGETTTVAASAVFSPPGGLGSCGYHFSTAGDTP
jgi:L-2-hydroxyglutarate oxidase LhgO